MSCMLRCFRVPSTNALASETTSPDMNAQVDIPQSSTHPHEIEPLSERSISSGKAQGSAARIIQAINDAFTKLGNVSGEHSLYCRISVLLEACRCELKAYDVRLAVFSTEGAAWVFLPLQSTEPDAAPAVAGWGNNILYRSLEGHQESVAVIRGYHAMALRSYTQATSPSPDAGRAQQWTLLSAAAAPITAPIMTSPTAVPSSIAAPRALSSGLPQADVHISHQGPARMATAPPLPPNTATCRTSPPEPCSVTHHSVLESVQMMPADMIAVPVRLEGRLAAALLVGWERLPGTAPLGSRAAASPSSPGVAAGMMKPKQAKSGPTPGGGGGGGDGGGGGVYYLGPTVIPHLQRLAQLFVFGAMCDLQQRRALAQLAQRFSLLPSAAGLHDFVTGFLDTVTELLYIKFSVRLQPIFLLTHGLATGGPAVLFSVRMPAPPGGQTSDVAAAAVSSGATVPIPQSQETYVTGPVVRLASGCGGNPLPSSSSLPGLRAEESANVVLGGGEGGGSSRVRAVRISVHHTLLAEALRAASKVTPATPATTTAAVAIQPPTNAADAAASTGAIAVNQYVGQGNTSTVVLCPLDPAAATTTTILGNAGGATAAVAPLPPPPSPPIHTTIVANISAHLLEEGAPCRDLLFCSNLAHCGTTGSLVLAVEAPSSSASGGGGGGAAMDTDRVNSSQIPSAAATAATAAGGISALSQPLGLLHSQRQFGMYVVCPDVLPQGMLAAIAAEVKQLLAMALSSCRDGALSVLAGGRCAWELYALQEQLLGINSSVAGGAGGVSMSLATAFAAASAASASASVTAAASGQALLTPGGSAAALPAAAAGSGSPIGIREALAPVAAATPSPLSMPTGRRGNPQGGRLLPRSFFAVVAASRHMSASGIRSAGCVRLPPSHMQLAVDVVTDGSSVVGRDLEQQLHESPPVANARLLNAATGSAVADQEGLRWLLASSPEVMLERAAAGPSPLEVMVSSMRTGLTAALTNAVVTSGGGDEARAALSQELAALRLYDVIGRGGQGVVFYGTLHGLETAVKVIVHRGKGEPLAHDGGDPRVGGLDEAGVVVGGGGDAMAGSTAAAAAQEDAGGDCPGDLSRIRKAQRGALELVVTGALSHPNIVQVLASFSNVIMVRCTYRNEPTPRLRLVAKDDPILASWTSPGPLNTVACLEYCDAGTLLEAAHAGAFRPAGSSILSGAVRPALVPLYMSLLEVALALRYLHSRRLVHCDLKPANVLLKSSTRDPRGWTCKLSDFGCVRLMTDLSVTTEDPQRQFLQPRRGTHGSGSSPAGLSQTHLNQQKQQQAAVVGFRVVQPLGTVAYMAPESFVRGHTLGPSIDIYAFGILMYELLMCRAPYIGIEAQALPRLVLRQHLRPEFHPLAPPEYCHLAARCWSSHVTRRPTAVQLVNEIEVLLADAQLKDSRKLQREATATAVPASVTAPAVNGARSPSPLQPILNSGGRKQPQQRPPPPQQQGEQEGAAAGPTSPPSLPPPPPRPQPQQQYQEPPVAELSQQPSTEEREDQQSCSQFVSTADPPPPAGRAAAGAATPLVAVLQYPQRQRQRQDLSAAALFAPAAIGELGPAAAVASVAGSLDATIEVLQLQLPSQPPAVT
ncbi:hypothetical protein VaNZ11_002244 [Volvox africanus]|uniref:Protein kinase domain-containing protein n=1 Tax=Volvox africanus TaxID=51714 RepID=A0ABQ5RRI0_9CHLO|nr:hypothetical protein VaNZ11_002244 [Volvox africanus]